MKPVYRGILIGAVQCLMVLSVAGKYAFDRATLPRAWVNATPVDPSLWVRGRYVSLNLQVEMPEGYSGYYQPVRIHAAGGRLIATPDPNGRGLTASRVQQRPWILTQPVAFYLPEHAADPSRLRQGEELWVEVSVPNYGPPRPLRLAIKKDGNFVPLALP
ncbi:MAG: hypothetical protein P4L56_16585 [Candidatus Sulfopaludibacter sp.]|nr:hypothetical protein [Candidatus Sulfopaludibacter sp.]